MIKSKTGPKGTDFLERIEFAPVRVSAALRRKGDRPALDLAAHIDDLLGSLSQRAASEIPAEANWGPRLFHGRTIRVTPGLLQEMKEWLLRMELHRMISESLEANPQWADLRELLW